LSDNLSRLRRLAGLTEADHHLMTDDEIEQYDYELDKAQYRRQETVKKLIAMAFRRCGFELELEFDDPILYLEDDDREATVRLDTWEIDLSHLVALQQSGLATRYSVQAMRGKLQISFNVIPGLENSVPPSGQQALA
jgi:hypothetical protein